VGPAKIMVNGWYSTVCGGGGGRVGGGGGGGRVGGGGGGRGYA